MLTREDFDDTARDLIIKVLAGHRRIVSHNDPLYDQLVAEADLICTALSAEVVGVWSSDDERVHAPDDLPTAKPDEVRIPHFRMHGVERRARWAPILPDIAPLAAEERAAIEGTASP